MYLTNLYFWIGMIIYRFTNDIIYDEFDKFIHVLNVWEKCNQTTYITLILKYTHRKNYKFNLKRFFINVPVDAKIYFYIKTEIKLAFLTTTPIFQFSIKTCLGKCFTSSYFIVSKINFKAVFIRVFRGNF